VASARSYKSTGSAMQRKKPRWISSAESPTIHMLLPAARAAARTRSIACCSSGLSGCQQTPTFARPLRLLIAERGQVVEDNHTGADLEIVPALAADVGEGGSAHGRELEREQRP